MAWNEPGGGNKDPWGPRKGGDQQGPPDLDEIFRKLKDRVVGLFGGGRKSDGSGSSSGGAGLILAIALLGIALLALFDSIKFLDERERGVVMRLGKFNRILQPGLNFVMPRPFEFVERIDFTQVRSTSAQVPMLTEDENIVSIDFAVQYRVADAKDFVFNVRDPEQTLSQATEAAVRGVVGVTEMDYLLGAGRAEIATRARDAVQTMIDEYKAGIEVVALNFQDVRPPKQVRDAFDDAVTSREDKQRFENEAEAYASQVIPEANGRAARVVADAKGYMEAVQARAEGEAQRFTLLLEQYLAAPEVTRKRLYLETMEAVLANTPKVLVDVPEGNSVMYLPIDKLMQGGATRSSDASGSRNIERSATTTVVAPSTEVRGRDTVRGVREGR